MIEFFIPFSKFSGLSDMSSMQQVSLEAQLQILREQIMHIENQIQQANLQHSSQLSLESLSTQSVLGPTDSCSSLEPPPGNYEPLYQDNNIEYQELLNQVQHVLEDKEDKEDKHDNSSEDTVGHFLQLVNDVLKPKENTKGGYVPKIEYDTMISEDDTLLEVCILTFSQSN